jgi:hypothetical protein
LASEASATCEEIRDAVARFVCWRRGPSVDDLRQHGIRVEKIGDGMESVSYQEFGDDE